MLRIVDTSVVDPLDRADLIRETICAATVQLEIAHHVEPERIVAHAISSGVPRIQVCSMKSTPATFRRTQRQACADEEPAVLLGLQVSSSSTVQAADRQAVLRPGEFVLCDTTAPYTLTFPDGVDAHWFRIPRATLAIPAAAIREVTGRRLGKADTLAGLTAAFLSKLAAAHLLGNQPQSELVADPAVELIRAVIATQLADVKLSRGPLATTLSSRIIEFIRANLADRDLSAARIAAEHNISVRYLYAILAEAGISLGDWVRSRRLERCRAELAAPTARTTTIASIAHRWGFADATHFSRVFREAYGMSPREWRELQLAPDRDAIRDKPVDAA